MKRFTSVLRRPCGIVCGSVLALLLSQTFFAKDSEKAFSEEERSFWAFQPIRTPTLPSPSQRDWIRNPIDAFVLRKLEAAGLEPAPEADRRTLIRRATLDLWGLPPSPEAIEAFVSDERPNAYERLIDRLLESPRYGERYARHWLDLVRYADSDGFKSDVLRPDAWRYRDYVIDSFNEDKPYVRFVKEQIAGDELYPNNNEAIIATGYLRLWPYEDNQPDMRRHWEATLDDITDVSGDVFLGVSLKCARCHEHKFDPITQEDYYRIRAFFAGISPWEDIRLGSDDEKAAYEAALERWEAMTAEIRAEMDLIKKEPWENQWELARSKLPPYMQAILDKEGRTPYEEQLARFAYQLMERRAESGYRKLIEGDDKERWDALEKALAEFDGYKPKELPSVSAVKDIGAHAPMTWIETPESGDPILPGFLSILQPGDAAIRALPQNPDTSARRAALSDWLTDSENPLTVRVVVNRMWQWHFGSGIVASSNDFGHLGDRPSHPELLDWLARKFVEEGWRLKPMHRLLMTSATYRQGSVRESLKAERIDPENRLLWRMPIRRMDAEQLRDSILWVSGDLDLEMGGPGVSEEESSRRSIYVLNKRNKLRTMMNQFDTPDLHNSCHIREATTTALQALAMVNGEWTWSQAQRFAQRLQSCGLETRQERVAAAFQWALGRLPDPDEAADAEAFFDAMGSESVTQDEAWADFCHVLINTNEFLYIN